MTPLPPDSAANSPLATLRQLKEMLDAGTITPSEFEALKQRLIFAAGAAGDPTAAATPAPTAPPAGGPPTPYLDTPGALTPEATPLLTPEPDWLGTPAEPLPLTTTAAAAEAPLADEPLAPYDEPAAERRNPLNLVFAIGVLLLFLGVVAYLALGRPATPDEHLTSTSQTAADTTAARPEVGPQAEQLTLPAAAPETLRVVPPAPPAARLSAVDSTVAAAPSAAATPAPTATPAPARPAAKPAASAPAITPAATPDTARSQF